MADWSSPNMCMCPQCVCVCLSWLLSAVRLPPLDWTPVAFAVKGHSTWVDILSLTSAMNLQSQAIQRLLYGAVSSPVTASY